MITIDQLKDIKERTAALKQYLSIDEKIIQVEEEQLRTQAPGFWDDAKAAEAQMKKVKSLQSWIDGYKSVHNLTEEVEIAMEMFREEAVSEAEVDDAYTRANCEEIARNRDYTTKKLNEMGIKCVIFNPFRPFLSSVQNNRDHRKMLVIDNDVAFTGGLNVADEYIGELIRFGNWKDSGVKVTGAAAQTFTVMFFDLWNAFNPEKKVDLAELLGEVEDSKKALQEKQNSSDEKYAGRKNYFVQPFDDSPLDQKSDGEFVYLDIIHRASKYVYIFTPYLILPDTLRFALCSAAMRGVDVRIVTPAIPDKKLVFRMTRANYGVLMRHGVKIYEYTPGFIHSKSIVADDECAVVGSINFDYRSLYLHFENAVYFTDKAAVQAVRKDCEETFEISEIRTEENTKRTWLGRIVDAVLRFTDTLA